MKSCLIVPGAIRVHQAVLNSEQLRTMSGGNKMDGIEVGEAARLATCFND